MNIATRREGFFARTRDDNAANIIVCVGLHNGIMEFRAQLVVHRVEYFRAVECDNRDTVLVID